MAETGGHQAAVERGNKRKLQQHYATTSVVGMNQGETDLQESSASTAYIENSTDSGILYLNPLTPKWNCGISEKCFEIMSEEEGGILLESKVNDTRTSEQMMTKLKLLKVKQPYLIPQTSNRNCIKYFADVSSTPQEEIWVQSQEIGGGIAGKSIFKQVMPKLKLFKVQKLNGNQQSPNGNFGIMDKSQEKEMKFVETPKMFCQATSKLKPHNVVKRMSNPQMSNGNGGIIENFSDIGLSLSEETKMWVKRKDNTEETARTSKEVTQKPKLIVQERCTISQTNQATNEDCATVGDCAEILPSENQDKDCFKSKDCAKDREDPKLEETSTQVTSKLKDLQVEENQVDGAKVSVNLKCKDDSKISRLLEAMKKRSEIDTEQRPFKCPHCHWAFKKLCYLQSHITTHSGLKPHVCDICGKAYSHQGTLQQHKRLHTGERPYRCPFCDRSYIWSSDYRKHIRTHTGEKPYVCKECGKDFIRSSDLRKHERNRHTNNKPFPCSHCGKTFNRPLSLKRHERKHLGERPYSCPDCGKKFALASRMAEHQKIHKGVRPFVCSVCAKCFTKSSNLTEHEAIHSGKRPHKCGECGVAFAMASRLVRHQYVHNKGKPHSCAGCGRNFSCLASLEQHQQLNCSARIFVCVQCDKSFMCADKLTQHMLHHDKTGSD